MDSRKKVCTSCGKNKSFDEFGNDVRHYDGKQSQCRACQHEAKKIRGNTPEGKAAKAKSDAAYRAANQEKFRRKRVTKRAERNKIVHSYKCKPCMDCNKSFPPHCMELDHVNGNKSGNVSEMKFTKISILIREIEKCEVVCANCHRIRTNNRREPSKEKRLLEHRAQVNQFKSAPCIDCGLCFPPVAMDLDHVRGEKVFEISNMGHYPRWKVAEELEKCEAVCANCHRIRTEMRRLANINTKR